MRASATHTRIGTRADTRRLALACVLTLTSVKVAAMAVAGAGLVLGVSTLVFARENVGSSFAERSPVAGVVLLAAGWLAIGVGVLATRRRPGRRYGALLVAAGFTWFLAEWDNPASGSALIFSLGVVLGAACPPLVAHAAFTYPSGRLGSRAEGIALACAYAATLVVLGVAPAVLFEAVEQGCGSCPTNLVSVTDNPTLADWFERAGVRLGVGWALALVVLVAWRVGRASPPARSVTAPVLVPAAAYLCAVAMTYAHDTGKGTLVVDDLDRRLRVAQGVGLALVALGMTWAWARPGGLDGQSPISWSSSARRRSPVGSATCSPRRWATRTWPLPTRWATAATSTRLGRRSRFEATDAWRRRSNATATR